MVRATALAGAETLSRAGLIESVGYGLEIIDDGNQGVAAIETAIATQPELIVIDAARSDIDWAQAAACIRRRLPGTAVGLIASDCNEHSLQVAASAGISWYIATDGRTSELIRAISGPRDGNASVPPVINVRIEEPVTPPSATAIDDGARPASAQAVLPLTGRQTEVLRLMAQGRRNTEIAETLCISKRTVESHARAILRKLHVHDRGQAALAAVKAGIVRL